MDRFCAALAPTYPAAEIAGMGGQLGRHGPGWALGTLPAERPAGGAGAYCAGSMVAVGEATLFNRAALVAELAAHAPPPTECSDGEVLLRLYELAGAEGLGRASGMFALAIYDGAGLTLVRD